jgi:hypothetical protein
MPDEDRRPKSATKIATIRREVAAVRLWELGAASPAVCGYRRPTDESGGVHLLGEFISDIEYRGF